MSKPDTSASTALMLVTGWAVSRLMNTPDGLLRWYKAAALMSGKALSRLWQRFQPLLLAAALLLSDKAVSPGLTQNREFKISVWLKRMIEDYSIHFLCSFHHRAQPLWGSDLGVLLLDSFEISTIIFILTPSCQYIIFVLMTLSGVI